MGTTNEQLETPQTDLIGHDNKVHVPTWGPPGSCRPQMGPMLAPWTLLSGRICYLVLLLGLLSCYPFIYDIHNDVIKWKHFLHNWPFVRGIHQSLMNSPHKGQWHRALMFSVICAWQNSWANNWGASGLRCHNNHYDITVICLHLNCRSLKR